jgi:hypothetical protein
MMDREKKYNVLTTPGLSIFGASGCKNCANLTSENICQKWAFPGKKWENENGCSDYAPFSSQATKSIPLKEMDQDTTIY